MAEDNIKEITIKNNYPLHYAVTSLLTKEALRNSTDLQLTTTKLGDMDNFFAAGISGRGRGPIELPMESDKDGKPSSKKKVRIKRGEEFAWTVRWDRDDEKGEHVNASFTQKNQKETLKYAIKTNGIPGGDVQYHTTIEKFTSRTGYNKKEYKAADAGRQRRLMREWGENGRNAWLNMPE